MKRMVKKALEMAEYAVTEMNRRRILVIGNEGIGKQT
jgi:hypothetical protein